MSLALYLDIVDELKLHFYYGEVGQNTVFF